MESMARNNQKKCDICGKEYRSDYLKKHKEICKKKVIPASRHEKRGKKSVRNFKKPIVKKNGGIEKYFSSTDNDPVVTEAETTVISSDSDIVSEADTNVISSDSDSDSENKASDEVMQGLRDLGKKNLTTNVISKCEWCNTDVIDLEHHKKTCNMKKVPCFKCKKEYPTYFIKAHFKKCKGRPTEDQEDSQGTQNKEERKKRKNRKKE